MKIRMVLASMLLLTQASAFACGGHDHGVREPVSSADLTVYDDATKAVMVSAGQPDFVIKLPGNQTTGYSWFFEDDNNNLVKMISSEYTADEVSEGVVGSGGSRTWHVHLNKSAFKVPTSLKLHFLYARPWELGGDIKEFTIRTHQGN